MVLKVVKNFYGIPKSGLHWYLTSLNRHLTNLRMNQVNADTCVLVRHSNV